MVSDKNQILLNEVSHTPVSQEIAELSGKHVGVKVEYRYIPGYTNVATVWAPHNTSREKIEAFLEEHERLSGLIRKPLAEYPLPDDYPVHQDYHYSVNGGRLATFIDGENMTVGSWKRLRIEGVEPITEVCLVDVEGRILRLPPKKEVPNELTQAFKNSRSSSKPKRRKQHKTFKIRKTAA